MSLIDFDCNLFNIATDDCLDAISKMTSSTIDAIVTDPPYGLSAEPDPVKVMEAWVKGESFTHRSKGFMGNEWDSFVPQPDYWKKAIRVLKPGGYAIVFAGSRTQDWMAMSMRFAGFEIVDTIMWVYGQGMPKSMNIGKAFSKLSAKSKDNLFAEHRYRLAANQWSGWGTQLKPAYEPILIARKPLDKTFVNNIMTHGVGGLNIDACRIPVDGKVDRSQLRVMNRSVREDGNGQSWGFSKRNGGEATVLSVEGRWPANLIHDGSDIVMRDFPEAKGQQGGITGNEPSASNKTSNTYGSMNRSHESSPRGDSGSASRFFYCAKATKKERHLGMDVVPPSFSKHGATFSQVQDAMERAEAGAGMPGVETAHPTGNNHPTIKPIALMRYLCRLVTPPGGVILDMYCGSGSTGMAAIQEGFKFIGIERSIKFSSIAKARCAYAQQRITGEPSSRAIKRKLNRQRGIYRKGDQIPLSI